MREIPQCWLTGQAAGAAAALAAQAGVGAGAVDVGTVDVGDLQEALRAQGAYLSARRATARAG